MLWEEYYEKIDEWANSTAVNRLSKLESFGPSEEIVYTIQVLGWENKKAATRLLKMAINAGVTFSGEELVDISLFCEDDEIERAIKASKGRFSKRDLEVLYGMEDEELEEDVEETFHMSRYELKETYEIALDSLIHAHEKLENALRYSIVDIGSDRRIFSIAKHAMILEAKDLVEYARALLEEIEECGQGSINISNIQLSVSNKVGFSDVFLDGFFLDKSIQKGIQKNLKYIEDAVREIENVLKKL